MENPFVEYGFNHSYNVAGCYSIAHLFKPDERCGIYILSFQNGYFYVGLATDFVKRYTQHRKIHSDIQAVFLKELKRIIYQKKKRN